MKVIPIAEIGKYKRSESFFIRFKSDRRLVFLAKGDDAELAWMTADIADPKNWRSVYLRQHYKSVIK